MLRANGFLLLPVTLTLVVVGALAYAMTQDADMGMASVDAEHDAEAARYLAEAAFNLARWKNYHLPCNKFVESPFSSVTLYRYDLANERVGTGLADRVGQMRLNNKIIDIGNNSNNEKGFITIDVGSVTTTEPAGSKRIVRTVPRFDLGMKKTVAITDTGGASTFILNRFDAPPQGAMDYMELTDQGEKNQSYGLVRFDLHPIPKNALVAQARLKLRRFDGEMSPLFGRTVHVHRITTAWDPRTATWAFPWSTTGGDYAADAVAGTPILSTFGAVNYYWQVDALAAGWINGTLPNHGMLLKPSKLAGSRFSGFPSGRVDGPELTVTYYPACT